MYFRITLFLSFILLALSDMSGQSCDLIIRGIVLDHHDNTILSYANIVIEGTDKGTQADSTGYYELSGLCPGTYTLICSHIDCEPVRKRIKVIDKFTEANFYPEHHAHELEQVIIKARSNHEVTNVKESIDKETLASLKTASLSQNLESLPGISSLKTGSNIEKPLIHGLFGSRIAIVQQSSKLEDQQWGNEHAPNVDVLMYDKIEVIKGAASVRFGAKAIGGAVVLEQDKIYAEDKIKGNLIANLQSNAPGGSVAFIAQKGFKKYKNAGWKIAFGGQKYGDLSAPDYVMSNTGYENLNAAASLGKEFDKWSHRMTLSGRYNNSGLLLASQVSSQSDIERALEASIPAVVNKLTMRINAPRQQVLHSSAIYNATQKVNPNHKLKYNLSYQLNTRKEFDVRRAGRTDIPSVHMNLHTLQAEILEDHQWNEVFSGSAGITLLSQENSNVPNTGRRPIIPYYTMINPGIFVFQQATWSDLTAEVGGRFDIVDLRAKYFDAQKQLIERQRNFNNVLLSAGLSSVLFEQVNVRINAGMGYRAPDVNELYSDGVHLSASAYEVGDPDLKSESSVKIIGEVSNAAESRFHYSVNVFYQQFQNFIYQERDGFVSTIAGLKLKYNYVQADAIFKGIDANVKWDVNNFFSLKSKCAYVIATNSETKYGIPLIPPFNADLEAIIHLNKKIENIPVIDLMVEGTYTAQQKQYNSEDLFKAPPGHYYLMNAGVKFHNRSDKNIWELKCNNLFNTRYSNYLNNMRYFSPQEAGRNFSIQYSYKF